MDPGSSAAEVVASSVDDVLAAFGQWLDRQRGLAPVTIENYRWNVERFLAVLPPPVEASVGLLDAGAVTAFMIEYCRGRNTNSAKSMARSVRSFLRFAHATGRTSVGLWSRSLRRRAGIWRRCRWRCQPVMSSGCSRPPGR